MAGKKAKAVEFVLDCSITVAWFFEDEVDAYTEAVENSLATARAVVPVLWPLDVANALLMSERRKRTTEAKVGSFLGLLRSLPVTHDAETNARAWSDTLSLARLHKLSAYDAAYLELALRRGLPVATSDKDLQKAARAVGVPVYNP
jgi:predicted nucleic acid-binding protein